MNLQVYFDISLRKYEMLCFFLLLTDLKISVVHLTLINTGQGELYIFFKIRNKLAQRHFLIGNALLDYVHWH